MPRLLIFLVLIFLSLGEDEGTESDSFIRDCRPSRCSRGGPTIRFPFRLNSQPLYCGLTGFQLSCKEDQTLLNIPSSSGQFNVKQINYRDRILTINGPDSWIPCPLLSYLSLNLSSTSSIFGFGWSSLRRSTYALVNCSKSVVSSMKDTDYFMGGRIGCLSGGDRLVYVMDGSVSMEKLPSGICTVGRSIEILESGPLDWTAEFVDGKVVFRDGGRSLRLLERLLERREFALEWSAPGIGNRCSSCEDLQQNCGFNGTTNQTFCFASDARGLNVGLIAGTSVSGTIALVFIVLVFVYIYKRAQRDKETRIKLEKFLAEYETFNPTRYTYSDIKKITKRFKHKIGQGGFGCVYKGQLCKGIPVAVKMLDISKGNGKEFINEVATIGRIHHINVVRLFGFCSEGSTRALIYEFMPNESLDKFIFSKDRKGRKHLLSPEMLLEIAIGIARGIEYLHQGCNQRILHFDIKPHNILLDNRFRPKISDFGLAKLCSKDQSIVSMTSARGTSGYIAPELFSNNFGMVSYKSDVYSYGMLVLEMIGGRKNTDADVENISEIYFPELIYERLIQGKELGVGGEVEGQEEITRKLAIVSLWCIQWSPADRPSMKKVVQMLEGNLTSLHIPPKPFISTTGP